MVERQAGLTYRRAAFANDIRGCAPAKAFGPRIKEAFNLADRWLDLSSGDLPKCLSGQRFVSIDRAREKGGSEFVAYDNPLYARAQRAVLRYVTGLSDKKLGLIDGNDLGRFQVIPGISGFMPDALSIAAESLGYSAEYGEKPVVVLIPPLHPHWIASVVEKWGYSSIVTIKRKSDGRIDKEHAKEVFDSIDRKFIVIATPDENPAGVCTPNSDFLNDDYDGLFNRIRNVPQFGVLLLDNIYSDLAWGQNSGKRYELIDQIADAGIRCIVMHSLSKAFLKPGLRIGGAAYVGPLDDIGSDVVLYMEMIARGNINNGISGGQLAALIEAYSGSEDVSSELVSTVGEIRQRVLRNLGVMNSGIILPAYPDGVLESAFYGLHTVSESGITSESVPWRDKEYRQWLIDRMESKLDLRRAADLSLWRAFRQVVGSHDWSGSNAFVLEMALNGVQMLPVDPFSPIYTDDSYKKAPHLFTNHAGDEAITFRTVLAYPEADIDSARKTIESVWKDRIDAFSKGAKVWRSAYK